MTNTDKNIRSYRNTTENKECWCI